MYKVKVDEKLLCFTGSVNGMEYVTDPDVKLVVNGVDSFSFAIYPQHPLYKEIECKVSRVKIWRDSELLFYGEVTGYSQDMYGIRTYDCEGALAWLNDLHFAYAISGATPKEVLYWYIKLYNQKLRDKSKSFELGTVTIHKALTQSGTEGTIARSSGVYPSFWEEIQDKLLDSFGGILRVRYVGSDTCAGYIDWLAIPDGTCSQDVRYAKNLLNCDWTYDCTALATAVVPLGKRKDSSGDNEVRLTIDKADDDDATFMIQYMTGTDDLVKSGNMVYSKSRMEKYGLIQQAVTFDDITDAGTLAYQGAVWLRQNGKAASTIRAEAIDLADIDESVEHFTHGDYVRTKLPGDSAESLFPITAIEIPIAAPENAKLTVGTQESGITSGSGGQGGGSIADAGSGADAMAHTHSNKGVLDKITEQDYADFKGAVNKAHVHANKDTLDKLTVQDYSDFKGTVNKAHVHDNKGTLDKITDVGWNTVYGNTHSHDNKSVLDKTTAAYTAADKKKLDGMDLTKYLHYNSMWNIKKDTWYKFASFTCTQYYNFSTAIFVAGFGYGDIRMFRITAGTEKGKPVASRIYLANITGNLIGNVGYVINGNTVNFFLRSTTGMYGYVGRIGATAETGDFIAQTDLVAATTAEAASIVQFTAAGTDVAFCNTAKTLTDSGWVAMTVDGYYAKSGTVKYRTYGKQITITGSVVLKNDIATSYPAPQYIASTTFDFSKIVGCSGVGRSSSGVGTYVAVENYNGDNLVCVYALGSKIAAGSTLYFTITGFID